MKILNPATGEIIKDVPEDDESRIAKKYESVRQGQGVWRKIALDERIEALKRFGDLLEENAADLARTLTLETGKPIREARSEIVGAVSKVRFFLTAKKWLSPGLVNHRGSRRPLRRPSRRSLPLNEAGNVKEALAFEPLGVVANISAWNYPYLVAMNVLPPALIAGNAVLYKPSEFATLSGLHIQRLLFEAGVPEDAFQTVVGGGEAGRAVIGLPVDGVFFTGSYKTGRSIASALAGRLIPVVLELGGKDPLYVMEDIDVEKAAANAVEGAFYNAGQSCCAVERIYVHEAIYEPFVAAFVTGVGKLKMGDPLKEDTTLGPLTRPMQLPYLAEQVQDAVAKGATVLIGGKLVAGRGNFFEPTVLTDVNHAMSVMKEETFGPVIGIQKVRNDDEALKLMADTDYGLTAAVFSKDEGRAKRILGSLDVGTVYWNCCDRVSPWLPWSGRKHSGLGTTLSYLGVQAFVRPKAYHLR